MSGFSITVDGEECPLSYEDFQKFWQWDNHSARPVRLAGLGVVVLSLGSVTGGIVVQVKTRKNRRQAAQQPMPPQRPQPPYTG